jgi:hypothetical protein
MAAESLKVHTPTLELGVTILGITLKDYSDISLIFHRVAKRIKPLRRGA